MTGVVRYLISRLATVYFQRPCVAEKMTVNELMKAQLTGSVYVIFVEEHKTASKYLASVALTKREYNLMCNWYNYVSHCKEVLVNRVLALHLLCSFPPYLHSSLDNT